MNVQDITRDCHIFLIRCVHYNLAGAFALGKDVEAVPCGSFKAEYSAFGGELGSFELQKYIKRHTLISLHPLNKVNKRIKISRSKGEQRDLQKHRWLNKRGRSLNKIAGVVGSAYLCSTIDN